LTNLDLGGFLTANAPTGDIAADRIEANGYEITLNALLGGLVWEEVNGTDSFTATGDSITAGGVESTGVLVVRGREVQQAPGTVLSSSGAGPHFIASSGATLGTAENPIAIDFASGQAFIGALGGAYVSGTTAQNTVFCDTENVPAFIVFNGVTISCSGSSSSGARLPGNIFFVAGVTSSQGSLAGDMYYLPDFITEETVEGGVAVFYIPSKGNSKDGSVRMKKDTSLNLKAG
jgi:hypothetical protein